MSEENMRQGVQAIRAGDKERGKELLLQALEIDDSNELAWLWLSVCVVDPDLKRECYERTLELDPNNEQAQKGLRRLDAKTRPKSSKRRKKAKKKTRNLTLVLVACIAIAVVCLGVWWVLDSNSRTPPTAPLRTAWINGIDKCPDCAEYDQLVMEIVNLYSNQDAPVPPLTHIPHGAQIDVLEEAVTPPGLCKVRYDGQEGYVQNMFVVDYDPIQENGPDKCY